VTTFGPPPASISLYERFVGAQATLIGRLAGLVQEWPDPCNEQEGFGLLEVDVQETLRGGEVPKRIVVRIAGARSEHGMQWNVPVEEGQEVLLLVSSDGDTDPPRYALQYDSAFRLTKGVLEVPEEVPLGVYATESGRLPLETVQRILRDLEADEADRWNQFEETEGRGWNERQYPEVEEVGDPLDEERPQRERGPREGWPAAHSPNPERRDRGDPEVS
jgi:hypothetical protein